MKRKCTSVLRALAVAAFPMLVVLESSSAAAQSFIPPTLDDVLAPPISYTPPPTGIPWNVCSPEEFQLIANRCSYGTGTTLTGWEYRCFGYGLGQMTGGNATVPSILSEPGDNELPVMTCSCEDSGYPYYLIDPDSCLFGPPESLNPEAYPPPADDPDITPPEGASDLDALHWDLIFTPE